MNMSEHNMTFYMYLFYVINFNVIQINNALYTVTIPTSFIHFLDINLYYLLYGR